MRGVRVSIEPGRADNLVARCDLRLTRRECEGFRDSEIA